MLKKYLSILAIFCLVVIFFWQFLFKGLLPIPSDTIVGLYYPFREAFLKTNPNGLPFKNFLITDPVRQQIPWKLLSVNIESSLKLPVWNPYNFAGLPLLANFQAGVFYPINLIFALLPFVYAWSFFILFQPLLALIFLYLYLRNLGLTKIASLFGSVSFAFSGFFVSWLTWGNILHTALWLPLILLSIDKTFKFLNNKKSSKRIYIWPFLFVFSVVSSFFAGHLQTFFYLLIFTFVYLVIRWFQNVKRLKHMGFFLVLFIIGFICILPQLVPTLQFISLSARNLDIVDWRTTPGWFIPWQNIVQFIAPDYFGNPATLNYFGIWNYGEFIGYIGIGPLIFAVFSLFRKDRKTLFFFLALVISLILALPTVIAQIPFKFYLPLISTSQPTRLIFIIDFCLSILAALGLDHFITNVKKIKIIHVLVLFSFVFLLFWAGTLFLFKKNLGDFFIVTRQNMILPTVLFIANSILIIVSIFLSNKKFLRTVFYLLVLILVFDLFRFGWKYEPFTNKNYLFPSTKITNFLKEQPGPFRVMSSDSRILPPNFSIAYKIQTLDGYDPLYLQRYGELMAAVKRGKPDISAPFGFNRIITPQNYLSPFIDLMNVKYVLSFEEIKNPKFKQVFTDGTVRIYENLMVFPRAFFVNTTFKAANKNQAIGAMFDSNISLNKTAIVEGADDDAIFKSNWKMGKIKIEKYTENQVVARTEATGDAFMVFTDSYYPSWHVLIDGKETKIYLTDYNFRGVVISKGKHKVEFNTALF